MNAHAFFADPHLRQAHVVCNQLGLPLAQVSRMAVVFHLHSPDEKQHWAVKCFTRPIPERARRYHGIVEHLGKAGLSCSTGLCYQEQGLYLKDCWYPVLKMDWVTGQPLDEFLTHRLDQPQVLLALCRLWLKLEQDLVQAEVIHGDLQHGNVLVQSGQTVEEMALKLVDYDAMVVPDLAGMVLPEKGHEAFQHPQREQGTTGTPAIDHFAHLVCFGALRCLAVGGRTWWERHHDGNNLLLQRADILHPERSSLLQQLWHSPSEELHFIAGHVARLSRGNLDEVPRLPDLLSDDGFRPLTPEERQVATAILGAL
ncbi:MAG: hypothetical protein U0840_08765 [Gemmataceae bacterium]